MDKTSGLLLDKENNQIRSITGFIIFYVLIMLVFIAISPHIFTSSWVSSSDFHACIEISSSFIAFIAAIACLMYYFGMKSRYFLIIGLGFLICGSEDLVHGIFGFKRLFAESVVDFSRFIPGTYVAGRSMLAIMIIAAALLENTLKAKERVQKEAVIFSSIAILLGVGATVLAFKIPLPRFIYPENIISRPVDFISAMLFIVAFLIIMKRFLLHRDIFSGTLLACILLNIGGQAYMSFSKQLFDVFFDTAHWANILSYCMPVVGITIESLSKMKRSNQEIMERKKMEKALKLSQIELNQIFKSGIPLCAINNNFTIIRMNDSFSSFFGVRADEAKGKKCHEIIKAPICNTEKCILKRVQESWEGSEIEIPVNNGETFIKMSGMPANSPGGELIGIVETFVDVTVQKRFQEKLKAQDWFKTGQTELNNRMRGEQDLSALTRNIVTFLAEYLEAQIGAVYIAYNNSHLHLAGSYAYKKRKDISNKFEFGEGVVGQAALEKESIMLTNVPKDYIAVTSGLGEAVPRNILVKPFINDGELKGVMELGSFYEFSDRHIEFLNQISESVAIAINSAQSREQMATLLEETQRQAEELEAQQEELQQTNEELEEQTQRLEEQKEGIQKKNAELKNTKKIIEEKARDLETASKYKSEFLANMSHELRTPLNSILLLSKMLSDNKGKNLTKKQVEFSHTIYSSGSDLLNLINEVLDLSKVESGKMELSIGKVPIRAIASAMEQNFKAIAEEKGVSFRVDIAEDLHSDIRTDEQRLDQILKNLLSNAFKFTSKGSVALNISRPDRNTAFSKSSLTPAKSIAFSVSDTGIGISEDKKKVIFEAFQQADGTTSRKYGGTGLGLSISREIAKMLGGEIHLESNDGKGSVFTLYIPEIIDGVQEKEEGTGEEGQGRKDKKLSIPKEELETDTEAQVSNKEFVPDDRKVLSSEDKSILIIEDDPKFAKILCDLSREKGFKVLIAEDGETGLHFADYYRPSAIILDISLPKMDGRAVMSRLKESPDTRHIPVHFISAADKDIDALKMGAVGYLTKPVSMDKIEQAYEKIENIISRPVKRLLVAEDDDSQRKAIEELIGNGDVKITGVSTGRDAFSQLETGAFDCMILDLGLPDMSGVELLAKIRDSENLYHIPIIIYTGRDLSSREKITINEYAEKIIIKDAKSPERLLDETTLFLHRVESNLPEEKRRMLQMVHDKESTLKGKKILLTDDDMRNVFAISSTLEQKGIEVLIGKNGKEALKCLKTNPDIDLIIMDIMMPEMDGYAAMREIRDPESNIQNHNVPIIALTAKAMKGDRAKCIEAGANDYLAKPINADKLISMLRVWLYG